MRLFRRRPRITEENYGRLMTAFGRTVDADAMVGGPAAALADRVVRELPRDVRRIDEELYEGAATYHLRLLAGAWIMASEGSVPGETAEVFEEALAWRFGSGALPERLGKLARGEVERDLEPDSP